MVKYNDKNKNKKMGQPNKKNKKETEVRVIRRRKKVQETASSEEISQGVQLTSQRIGHVIDPRTRRFIPEFDDFHLQMNKLSGQEMAFFNEIMDSPTILGSGEFVEREISGGRNAQPDLRDFNSLTDGGRSLDALLGQNILSEEAIESLRKIRGLDVEQFVEDFEKFLIESFLKCNNGPADTKMLLKDLVTHKNKALAAKFNQIPENLFYKIFHQSLLRISILFQEDEWYPEEPGAKEENFFHGWTTIFKDLFAKYLVDKKIIEDPDDLSMFNTSGTPADYLAQTDSFFSIVNGENKGLVFGIDYSVDPRKPERRSTGRRFYIDSGIAQGLVNQYHDEIQREGLKNLLDEVQSKKTNMDSFNRSLLQNPQKNEKYKRLQKLLLKLRKDIYEKVFKPGFDEYVAGVESEVSRLISTKDSIEKGTGRVSSRYISDVHDLSEGLGALQERRIARKKKNRSR